VAEDEATAELRGTIKQYRYSIKQYRYSIKQYHYSIKQYRCSAILMCFGPAKVYLATLGPPPMAVQMLSWCVDKWTFLRTCARILTEGCACFAFYFLCRDLSNNNIGGTIPEDLPVTLQNLYVLFFLLNSFICDYMMGWLFVSFCCSFLSDNELTGSIPASLSELQSLSAL
jgi:hypothetical protein